jgi:hypothetical protein
MIAADARWECARDTTGSEHRGNAVTAPHRARDRIVKVAASIVVRCIGGGRRVER